MGDGVGSSPDACEAGVRRGGIEFEPMRTMALDVGSKGIGVAVSDELGITAQPLTTLRRTSFKADIAALASLATEHSVTTVVVGLPRHMDGSEGASAAEARRVGDALLARTALVIEYWDERLTTVAAERALIEANVSRQRRREVVDQVAASLILQGWLEARAVRDWSSE